MMMKQTVDEKFLAMRNTDKQRNKLNQKQTGNIPKNRMQVVNGNKFQ